MHKHRMMAFALPCLGLSLLVFFIQGCDASNIAVDKVSVVNQDDNLTITVTFRSGPDTQPSWVMPVLRNRKFANLDFEVENLIGDDGARTTSATISHEEARAQNPKISLRVLILRNIDCVVRLFLPEFSTLLDLSDPLEESFDGLSLTLRRKSNPRELVNPGDNVVLNEWPYSTSLQAVLQSSQLSNYEISDPYVMHTRFAMDASGVAQTVKDYGHRPYSVVTLKNGRWSGTADRQVFNSIYVKDRGSNTTGVGHIWSLSLKRREVEGAFSLVTRVEFEQNFYILYRNSLEAIPSDTVSLRVKHSHFISEYDTPMTRSNTAFSLKAIGNPLPDIRLFRACSEVGSAELEVTETRTPSKYEIIHFLRFRNASDSLPGSYTVVATSGLMEAREVLSVGYWD